MFDLSIVNPDGWLKAFNAFTESRKPSSPRTQQTGALFINDKEVAFCLLNTTDPNWQLLSVDDVIEISGRCLPHYKTVEQLSILSDSLRQFHSLLEYIDPRVAKLEEETNLLMREGLKKESMECLDQLRNIHLLHKSGTPAFLLIARKRQEHEQKLEDILQRPSYQIPSLKYFLENLKTDLALCSAENTAGIKVQSGKRQI